MPDQEQNIGFQNPDEDEMPSEMKDYGLAAFQHAAGLGPHPGVYQGPPRKRRTSGEPTETDLQSAAEEPLSLSGEASARKMRAAQEGGPLGPSDIEKEQVQQSQAQAKTQATQQAAQAGQAQAQQSPVNAPPAPSGPTGVSTPYEAQNVPQPPPSTQDVEPEVPGMQSPASQVQPPPAPDQGQ